MIHGKHAKYSYSEVFRSEAKPGSGMMEYWNNGMLGTKILRG